MLYEISNVVFVLFKNENETQNLNVNKKKIKKKKIKISTIVLLFKCLYNHTILIYITFSFTTIRKWYFFLISGPLGGAALIRRGYLLQLST